MTAPQGDWLDRAIDRFDRRFGGLRGAGPGGERMTGRRMAVTGALIGALGLGYALWCGDRWTVAFCGVVWGSTVTLAVLTFQPPGSRE